MNKEKLSIEIRKILNKHDPAGVIYEDNNLDEYDPEINEIIEAIEEKLSLQHLSEQIYNIFVKYFNEEIAGDRKKYEQIAKELFSIPELGLK